MARYTRPSRRRGAFTLVEMLVSTALIIFILVIISSVFTTGIGALRTLRGVGHMQDKLRYAVSTLREDLARPHFGRETDGLHGPNLSQQRADLYDWTPPKEGFFRIWQGSVATMEDAKGIVTDTDGDGKIDYKDADALSIDGLVSYVANNHALHFTVRAEPNTAQGSGRDQFFFTNSFNNLPTNPPGGNYIGNNTPARTIQSFRMGQAPSHINNDGSGIVNSPWAEVAYYLRPSQQQAGSSPLYTLYRRRRLLVDIKEAYPDANLWMRNSGVFGPGLNTGMQAPVSMLTTDVSWYDAKPIGNLAGTSPLYLNTPLNINVPYRRLGMQPPHLTKPQAPAGVFFNNPIPPALPAPATEYYRSINEEAIGKNITNVNANPGGDDILLENVLSFEIKATWDVPTDARINRAAFGVAPPTGYFTPAGAVQNPEYPFDNLPMTPSVSGATFGNDAFVPQPFNAATNPRVFDTWRGEDYVDVNATSTQIPSGIVRYSLWNTRYELGQTTVPPIPGAPPGAQPTDLRPLTIPLRIRVKAIQIRLRVWDTKTQQARQVTVVQDL